MMFWYERKRMARKRFDLKSTHPSTKSDLAFKRLQSRISSRCSRLKCSKLLAAVFSDPCSLKLFRICSVAALACCSSIFFIEEVSLVCFDRSVATLHRRASVYTTFPSLWFSSLGVFIAQLRINVVLTAFFWSLSMLYWTLTTVKLPIKINKDQTKLVYSVGYKYRIEFICFLISWANLLLPWAICFCRAWICFCRERFAFTVSEFAFFAVSDLLLLWQLWATIRLTSFF